MTVAEIKEAIDGLTEDERDEIIAHLVHREQMADGEFLDRVTRRTDDAGRYVRWGDVKEEFLP